MIEIADDYILNTYDMFRIKTIYINRLLLLCTQTNQEQCTKRVITQDKRFHHKLPT